MARKVLSLSGSPSSQDDLVAEIRNICDVTGPEVFHCEGEWTMNWLVVGLQSELTFMVDFVIQIGIL